MRKPFKSETWPYSPKPTAQPSVKQCPSTKQSFEPTTLRPLMYHPIVQGTGDKLTVLITREQIAAKVVEMGVRITTDFAGQSVVLIGVLRGAAIFLADLARQIDLDVSFDFIAVSSYGNSKQSGEIKLIKDVDDSLEGRNVILVEDILDTGITLTYIRKLLLARQPRAFKVAALLDKVAARKVPAQADYVGFQIPDQFVVGYGLDFGQRYRNLPHVCIMETHSDGN